MNKAFLVRPSTSKPGSYVISFKNKSNTVTHASLEKTQVRFWVCFVCMFFVFVFFFLTTTQLKIRRIRKRMDGGPKEVTSRSIRSRRLSSVTSLLASTAWRSNALLVDNDWWCRRRESDLQDWRRFELCFRIVTCLSINETEKKKSLYIFNVLFSHVSSHFR